LEIELAPSLELWSQPFDREFQSQRCALKLTKDRFATKNVIFLFCKTHWPKCVSGATFLF
jgi:hypothetical protein